MDHQQPKPIDASPITDANNFRQITARFQTTVAQINNIPMPTVYKTHKFHPIRFPVYHYSE